MNKFKPNSNEEMSAEQAKTTRALNELLSFALSKRPSNKFDENWNKIWEQADIISTFIFKK